MIPSNLPNTAVLGIPVVLLPYQQEWIADKSPLKVEEKSRRTGLTWAEAADDVLIAAAEGGQNVYYIGYNQDMAIEYVEACAMWAKAFNYVAGEIEEGIWQEDKEDKHIKTYTIRFPDSGRRIVALSSRPANLRGKQGVVVIDEAAFHDKLDELLKAALALLIWGGKVRVISTHDGDQNPFNELIQEIRAGKRKGSVHRVTFQEAIGQGLYRRVCLRLGRTWNADEEKAWMDDVYAFYGDAAEEELDVVPSQGSGTYLSRAIIEKCMRRDIPVLTWECKTEFALLPDHIRKTEALDWCETNLKPLLDALPKDSKHYFGEDFARTGDLSIFYPLTEMRKLVYRTPFILELRNVPFKEQELILYYILDRLPLFMHGCFDARGNGQYLAERAMQRYGATRITQVMLSDAWYREEMPRLKSFFEDGALEVAADSAHLDDYRAIKMIKGVAKLPDVRTTDKTGKKRHGDAAIGCAMAVAATRQDGITEYAYHGIKKTDYADLPRDVRTTHGIGRRQGCW